VTAASFLEIWAGSATTSAGLFWTAFWAFALGYLISSAIQVFVTRERMQRAMGEAGAKSVGLATFFGFISSSCSFAALATTRALFAKGAGLVPALAFLLASTNLVIELGIVISVFMSWQFVVGEYVGGLLLIALTWLAVAALRPQGLIDGAREHARDEEGPSDDGAPADWREMIRSKEGWLAVARKYRSEWAMVWQDVTIGFTVAGVIATAVPRSFFQALFIGSGADDPAFWEVLIQTLVGPLAAFFTFIGSMGNIPLAAVLFANGVSFAGVIAFIFSDLVVFPVLRIQARYYGWRMALFILAVFLFALVGASLILHYGFTALDLLPDGGAARSVRDREFFAVDATMVLNVVFAAGSVGLLAWVRRAAGSDAEHDHDHGDDDDDRSLADRVMRVAVVLALTWLGGGLIVAAVQRLA
jgi:hypothetical protein